MLVQKEATVQLAGRYCVLLAKTKHQLRIFKGDYSASHLSVTPNLNDCSEEAKAKKGFIWPTRALDQKAWNLPIPHRA